MTESSSFNNTSRADSAAGWPPAIVGCSLPLTEAMVKTLSSNTWSNTSSETQSQSGTEHTYRYHPFYPQFKYDVTPQAFDDLKKLQAYNIYPGTKMLIPTDIQDFIRDVLMHTQEGDRSPNARRVVEACEASRFQDDDFFSHVAVPWLVIPFGRPAPLLTSQPKTRLSSKWLPTARPNVKRIWSKLSDAWPDAITGFTRHAHLDEDETQSAFTQEEENMFKPNLKLTDTVLFPFLTAQYKPANGESLSIATLQGARDGACIVNHLRELYRIAYAREPTPLETCHFSITANPDSAVMWVHWSEMVKGVQHHYMEDFESCTNRKAKSIEEFRVCIKNLIEYATEEKLDMLKEALALYDRNKKGLRGVVGEG